MKDLLIGASALRFFIATLFGKEAVGVFNIYVDFSNRLLREHGRMSAIKILKDLNSRVKLVVLKRPDPSNITFGGIWFKVNALGLPKSLKALWDFLPNNPRTVLFIVNCVYILRCKPTLNVDTVEASATTSEWKSNLSSLKSYLNLKFPHIIEVTFPTRGHFTLKSGPLGPRGILHAGLDLLVLRNSSLYDEFMQWMQILENKLITNRITLFVGYYDWVQKSLQLLWPSTSQVVAKLVFLSNPAGKTRIVYILNYWVQEALLPLHNAMMEWLRAQPQDATFDQNLAVEKVKEWTKAKLPVYSFDLSAATDRWPRHHQYEIIKFMFGDKWANFWLWAMEISPYSPALGRNVVYATGQPMGAYGSWGALAVCHHITIRHAAWVLGISNPKYVVLGDDVCLVGHDLATEYLRIMESLGVSISHAKSVYPKAGEPIAAEFAKHLLIDGMDLTPVSPNLVLECFHLRQWWKMIELLRQIAKAYEIGPIAAVYASETNLSPLLVTLLSGFSKAQQQKLLIVLLNPEVENSPLLWGATPNQDWKALPNPWDGVDDLTFITVMGMMKENEMQDSLQSLHKLEEQLQASAPTGAVKERADEILVTNPAHPVWWLIEGLQGAIRASHYKLAHGDHMGMREGEFDTVIVDAKQLQQWLVNLNYAPVAPSMAQLRTKLQFTRIVTALGHCKNPNDFLTGYDD